MEQGEDVQADVFARVWNHTHDQFDPFLVEQVHNPFDVRHTGQVHRFQAGQVGQETEARREVGRQQSNFFGAPLRLFRPNPAAVADLQQVSGFIDFRPKHCEALRSPNYPGMICSAVLPDNNASGRRRLSSGSPLMDRWILELGVGSRSQSSGRLTLRMRWVSGQGVASGSCYPGSESNAFELKFKSA